MAWMCMFRFVTGFAVFLSTVWVFGLADSRCDIQYERMHFAREKHTSIRCRLDGLSTQIKWWRSTEMCGEFSEHSQCDACDLRVPVNNSFFYYCCTAASVTDVLSVSSMNRRCFELEVCTDIVQGSISTVAFFNQPVQIFVEMFSYPPPQQRNAVVTLVHNRTRTSNIGISQVSVVGFDGARLIWRYVIQVPDLASRPDEGVLTFDANFDHSQSDCPQVVYAVDIPVRRENLSTESLITTHAGAETGTELGTEVVQTSSDAELRGYQIGFAVACVLCSFLFISVVVAVFAAFFCVRKRNHVRRLSSTDSSSDPYGVSPMDCNPTYDRQDTATSTTSTQPLIANPQNRNHPLTLAMSGALPDFTCTAPNEHTPTANGLDMPTPTVQSRPLLETPEAKPTLQALSGHEMVSNNAQMVQGTGDQPPVYEHLHEAVPLEVQQTDSTTVEV